MDSIIGHPERFQIPYAGDGLIDHRFALVRDVAHPRERDIQGVERPDGGGTRPRDLAKFDPTDSDDERKRPSRF